MYLIGKSKYNKKNKFNSGLTPDLQNLGLIDPSSGSISSHSKLFSPSMFSPSIRGGGGFGQPSPIRLTPLDSYGIGRTPYSTHSGCSSIPIGFTPAHCQDR